MKTKKTPGANLESKRSVFFGIGIIIALAFVITAFEWRTAENDKDMFISRKILDPPCDPPPITIDKKEIKPKKKIIKPVLEFKVVEKKQEDKYDFPDIDPETLFPEEGFIDFNHEVDTDEVFDYIAIKEKPRFLGGDESTLLEWIYKHVKYPKTPREIGIEGTVLIGFIIDEKGSVTDVKILHSVDPCLDREALRVTRLMPDWTPGQQNMKPVKVAFKLPYKFELRD